MWFCTKLQIWRASSIILPIHVTSEAIDLSAKIKELTMQCVQNVCGYLASMIMLVALQTSALSVMICTQESKPTSSITLMKNSPYIVHPCIFQEHPSLSRRPTHYGKTP